MRLLLTIGLILLGSGCTSDSASEAGPARPAVTSTPAFGDEPTLSATADSGYVLSQVRRGCGPSDRVGVLGSVAVPRGLLDYDGLSAEVRSSGDLIGSAPLETPEFIVYPEGNAELPEITDVSIVREDGEVLVTQSDVDLRFRPQDPQGLCG